MPEHSTDSFEASAGPAAFKAAGHTVINILLTMAIVGMAFYGIWTTQQQTLMIHQEHYAIMLNLGQLTRANENVFLSSMLPDNRKKAVPPPLPTTPRKAHHDRTIVWTVLENHVVWLCARHLRIDRLDGRNQPVFA